MSDAATLTDQEVDQRARELFAPLWNNMRARGCTDNEIKANTLVLIMQKQGCSDAEIRAAIAPFQK